MSFVQKAFGAKVNDYEIMRNMTEAFVTPKRQSASRVMFAQQRRASRETDRNVSVCRGRGRDVQAVAAGAIAIENFRRSSGAS